jgi:hypothetical protein
MQKTEEELNANTDNRTLVEDKSQSKPPNTIINTTIINNSSGSKPKTIATKRKLSASKSASVSASASKRRTKKTMRRQRQKHEVVLFLSCHAAQLCNNLAKNDRLKGVNVTILTYMQKYGDDSTTCSNYHAERYEEMDELGLNVILRNIRNPEACVSNYPENEQQALRVKIQQNPILASLECVANVLQKMYLDYIPKNTKSKNVLKKYTRGFHIVQPLKDRFLAFEPNEGEKNYDPHYGLHIIHVNNPPHKSFEHFNVHNYEKDLLDYGNITDIPRLQNGGIVDIHKNVKRPKRRTIKEPQEI